MKKSLLLILFCLVTASTSHAKTCVDRAVELLKLHSKSGFATYNLISDKSVFNEFIDQCSNTDDFYELTIPTAVHETNHMIRATTGAYHLVSGEMIKALDSTGLVAPHRMTSTLPKSWLSDNYFETYMKPGNASSAEDFSYLLDELNAYANDQQVSNDFVKLAPMKQRQAGLPALLSFVAAYTVYIKTKDAKSWAILSSAKNRNVISKLWMQGHSVLNQACRVDQSPDIEDAKYITFLCDARTTTAMGAFLGVTVACPAKCR